MKVILVLVSCVLVSACNTVKPWQRGTLTKPEMQWISDSADFKFSNHVYFSKEGSAGGEIAVGGGCGCN